MKKAEESELREKLAQQLYREIGPLLDRDTHQGGYGGCGCGLYDQILKHAVSIVRGEQDGG
jgi:hypothetical protein